jgi:hypothetical protein
MTNAIEQTKRDMYNDLKRFEHMVGSTHLFKTFQDSLEDHLEELRKENAMSLAMAGSMREERDAAQRRVQAVDHAYFNLDQASKIAGEELIRVQGIARQHLDDCRSAEKLSDSLDEKLRDARSVIAHQEQLIAGQRLAIAELYMAGRPSSSAVATLQRLGYTDHGGQLWKPPLGRKPDFEMCTNDAHIQNCKCGRG